jgi:hypothetical protein
MKHFLVIVACLAFWVGVHADAPTPKHITTWSIVIGCPAILGHDVPRGITLVFSDGTIETVTSDTMDRATKVAITKAVGDVKGTIIHFPCAAPLT